MFDMQLIKNVLLVLPLSVIPTWSKEFSDWAPGIKVDYFHGPAAKRLAVSMLCNHLVDGCAVCGPRKDESCGLCGQINHSKCKNGFRFKNCFSEG